VTIGSDNLGWDPANSKTYHQGQAPAGDMQDKLPGMDLLLSGLCTCSHAHARPSLMCTGLQKCFGRRDAGTSSPIPLGVHLSRRTATNSVLLRVLPCKVLHICTAAHAAG
jgi:hypothetical protein